jgi:hypothetical protein
MATSPIPFAVADTTKPADNRLRQPNNPWLLNEVEDAIERAIDLCGEPDEGQEWDPAHYGRVVAAALLRDGLITLRPGPLPNPTDLQVEQCLAWLQGLAGRALRAADVSSESPIWPRDASEAQRAANILNSLRSKL